MNQYFNDMIYLCGCAVNNIEPEKSRVEKMDIEKIYSVADYHTLTSITAYALEKSGVKDEKFYISKGKATRKNILFDIERKKLFSFCEESKIWYMPLKGCILKEYYPYFSMRQMADNDILFNSEYQAEIKKYFEDNGYETVSYKKGNHDVYRKPPVLNFEMHTSLFSNSHDVRWKKYYENIKTRLRKDSNNNYGYHFSDEDFYIYIKIHEYKHYSNGGTGIRSLLDSYVFLKKKSSVLNFEYIEKECLKLGISDFEKQSRKLSFKVFGENSEDFSENEKNMLERYLFSGTYGTFENAVHKKIEDFQKENKNSSELKYILRRVFPPMNFYKECFPTFYRFKIFIPAIWLYRIIRSLTVRRKLTAKELEYLRKYNN